MAHRQYGNITTEQLREAGLTDAAILHRSRRGRIFPIHHGVYAVGRPPLTPHERAAAAVLACGPGAVLSHDGALALWGFAVHWPPRFDVIAPLDRRPRGIRVHHYQRLLGRDLTVQLGIPVTSPARTILDCAPRQDLAARTRAVNDALHSGFLKPAALADVRRRFPHHPGARLLDPHLHRRGTTRSRLEDTFLAFCARHGLPTPLTNVQVAGHVVDVLFPEHRLIVEVDSWEFHGDRAAFETDRNRDADTLAAGHVTVRVTSARLESAQQTAEAARLRSILRQRAPGGG